jgi:hypothetical protein
MDAKDIVLQEFGTLAWRDFQNVKRTLIVRSRLTINIILALIADALFRSCQATTPPKAYQRVSTPKTACFLSAPRSDPR